MPIYGWKLNSDKSLIVFSCQERRFKNLNLKCIYRIFYKNAKKANRYEMDFPYWKLRIYNQGQAQSDLSKILRLADILRF